MTRPIDISVVIPLLNESDSLEELYQSITSLFAHYGRSYEIIFVDDGSTDGSTGIVEALAAKDGRVKGIQFRKNYGKSAGLAALAFYALLVLSLAPAQAPRKMPSAPICRF